MQSALGDAKHIDHFCQIFAKFKPVGYEVMLDIISANTLN